MRDFVKTLTARLGINGLGRALGLNGSSVLAWTRGEALPSADMVRPLAALAQVDPDVVLRAPDPGADGAGRAAARAPSGGAGGSARRPHPASARAADRRKLAAWAFAVASGAALGQPLGEGAPRPIMIFDDLAPTRGILSRWRRARAA